MGAITVDSLLLWIGAAAALVGAVVGAWAVRGDRARGRRRCPRCWYSMDGTAGLTCPECGRTAASERRLLRARCRKRWAAVAALLVLVGLVVAAVPRARRDGALWPVPTRTVAWLVVIGGEKGPFGREILRRMGYVPRPNGARRRSVSDWDRVAIHRRLIRGAPLARSGSDRWRETYGSLLRRTNDAFMHSDEVRSWLGPMTDAGAIAVHTTLVEEQAALPYRFKIRTRDTWPVGSTVLFKPEIEHWWPPDHHASFDVRWRANGGAASGTECTAQIPFEGDVVVDIEVGVKQQVYQPTYSTKVVGHERATVRYTTAPSLDDIITPVRSPELDALLGSSVVLDHGIHANFTSLSIDGGRLRALGGKGYDDVAFAFDAAMYHNGSLIRTVRLRWLGRGEDVTMSVLTDDWETTRNYIATVRDEGGWTVTLRPNREWAPHELDAKRYWAGEAEAGVRFTPMEPAHILEPEPLP